MKQYRYHICVSNENSVKVKKWIPGSTVPNESFGIFQKTKITDQIHEAFQNPVTLKNEQVQKVGEALFETLFDEQLRKDFLNFYQKVVRKLDQTLEVVLEINETALPEAVAYPWEMICLPQRYHQKDIHFATDPKLNFFRTRYNLEEEDKPSIQFEQGKKLKISLAIARPTADPLLRNVEYQTIQNYLSKLASQFQETIELLPVINPATPKKVSDRLREDKPDIFHFIGHGQLRKENAKEVGQIAFVSDLGEASWKKANYFGSLFDQHRPKIVILQACETGKQSELNAFTSVAYRLMLQGIPVIIAMQDKVYNQTVSAFIKEFYEEIIEKGNSVDLAVQQARYSIAIEHGYERRDFAIPVIYMNASDGELSLTPSVIPQDGKHQPETDLSDHLSEVTKALTRGKLVPFLGSGINFCDRSNNHKKQEPKLWNPSGDYPPTRSELAIFLEQELFGDKLKSVQCPLCESEKENLPEGCPIKNRPLLTRLLFQHVSQFGMRDEDDGERVEKAINKISTHRYTPNQFHSFFAQLPGTLSQKGYQIPKLIVTANFDSTLERAFNRNRQEFDLVYYVGSAKKFFHLQWRKDDQGYILRKDKGPINDPNIYEDLDPDKYPVILKLYGPMGGADNPKENFVITEDHFIDYLAQSDVSRLLPASLLELLHHSKILFVGYCLSHWDERVVLHRLWPKETFSIDQQKCWAIQLEPQPLDRELWKQAEVELIQCTSLEDYITELKQRVEDLGAR
ncbi:MAG: CHAT domain-containing protein [Xenococcus sp. (in: cyanobacteria)]